MTKVEFRTEAFQAAHGRAPRGTGAWAFSTNRNPRGDGSDIFWAQGTFTKAKGAARKHFAAQPADGAATTQVWVLS